MAPFPLTLSFMTNRLPPTSSSSQSQRYVLYVLVLVLVLLSVATITAIVIVLVIIAGLISRRESLVLLRFPGIARRCILMCGHELPPPRQQQPQRWVPQQDGLHCPHVPRVQAELHHADVARYLCFYNVRDDSKSEYFL